MNIEEALIILKDKDCFVNYPEQKILDAIKCILVEREELKVLEDDFKDKRIVYIDTPEFKEAFIPKQKVKTKIGALQMEERYDYLDNKKAIQTLEELLEE